MFDVIFLKRLETKSHFSYLFLLGAEKNKKSQFSLKHTGLFSDKLL